MLTLSIFLGILAALVVGCSAYWHPPEISGYHWRCGSINCALYDSDGVQVADVVGSGQAGESQGCAFNHGVCKRFETTRQAFDYIRSIESKNP